MHAGFFDLDQSVCALGLGVVRRWRSRALETFPAVSRRAPTARPVVVLKSTEKELSMEWDIWRSELCRRDGNPMNSLPAFLVPIGPPALFIAVARSGLSPGSRYAVKQRILAKLGLDRLRWRVRCHTRCSAHGQSTPPIGRRSWH